LTNDLRQVLRAWGGAGELTRKEQALERGFKEGKNEETMLSLVEASKRAEVQQYLAMRNLTEFYRMLGNPDQGLFRSSYLRLALDSIAGKNQEKIHPEYAYSFVQRTKDICQRHGAEFTLVLVPEAFSVDAQMQREWESLIDMNEVMQHRSIAGEQLLRMAKRDGIHVIDLHVALNNTEGTYLNPDGHWSQKGADIAAAAVAKELS
jgi:hypothetical protein